MVGDRLLIQLFCSDIVSEWKLGAAQCPRDDSAPFRELLSRCDRFDISNQLMFGLIISFSYDLECKTFATFTWMSATI